MKPTVEEEIATKRIGVRAPPPTSAGLETPLRAAGKRVLDGWCNAAGESTSPEEVTDLMPVLVAAIAEAREGDDVDPRLRSVLGRRLLELLRAELVAGLTALDEPPAVAAILTTLRRFEEVRRRVEPDWDQHFASRLAGPGGLELVVDVAHDLRSPLTSILFLAEILQKGRSGEVNELQHRQLGLVYSAALGLSTVASNVIELARGGNRLADDEPSPFSVREILESVHDIIQPIAEEKGLSVQLGSPPEDHRLGHPQALSRVLLNLTTNALKFTEEGFVKLEARSRDRKYMEFSIRDSGNGISPQALETLYLPFRRTPAGDGYAFSGTGLGLAISRKLVEAMGAELNVETKPGWGTRFYFELYLPTTGGG